MHVSEVNPVVNSTSLRSLECKSPHWQNPKLAPNSLKFLVQVGNRTQASRELMNLTRIKHRAQPTLVILMAVYPAQRHCEESTSLGTWVSTYFLIEQGLQPGLEPTTSRLLWQVSSHFTDCATSPAYVYDLSIRRANPCIYLVYPESNLTHTWYTWKGSLFSLSLRGKYLWLYLVYAERSYPSPLMAHFISISPVPILGKNFF